jgi:glutaredoxin
MNKNKIVTISVILIILLLALGIIYFKGTGAAMQNIPSEEIAKWIGEHSTLYVQTGCSHCITQENLFGENKKYLTIVDCITSAENKQMCINAGIEGTPTWIINGQKYEGIQTIEKLKELTNYK